MRVRYSAWRRFVEDALAYCVAEDAAESFDWEERGPG